MVPYNTLFQPEAIFSFFERTFHREGIGGWERWEFEIDNEQYLFDGDVRYLPEEKQSVLVFGFFKKENNTSFAWDYIRKTDANSAKLIGCVMEIIDKASLVRDFKYVATLCAPEWQVTANNFLSHLSGPVSNQTVKNVLKIIKPEIQIYIDMGQCNLHLGDITVNPSYKVNNVHR